MSNLLSGLEALGLGGVSDMDVYEDTETKAKRVKKEAAGAEVQAERTITKARRSARSLNCFFIVVSSFLRY